MLELDWERIQLQINWKLEHCFSAGPIDPTHASQSSTGSPGASDSPDSISTNANNTSSPTTSDDTSNNQNSDLQTENIVINNSSLSDPQDAPGSEPQQPSHSFLSTDDGQEANTQA